MDDQVKPAVSPQGRFAAAVVAVMSSASYPLAGHILTELQESAAAMGESASPDTSGQFDFAPISEQIEDKTTQAVTDARLEMNAEATRLVEKLNTDLNAAVSAVMTDIKAEGLAQVAAVKAAKPAKAATGTE